MRAFCARPVYTDLAMGRALYRKHRPKKLSEIIGQEHITDTLSRALKQGMLSHAYLLTGPRGVGKTSIARILAHEVNGLAYEDESTHLDIIEIDAASNRRIDEIRELNERVHIAPTSAKYKVYIIDEVHMLTKEAFNALLKTLEEPPEHVIFILATTEAHKVPETIQSRTQRFTFKPVTPEKVVAHLSQIAKAENIDINLDALGLIAAHGEGSFRDSISLLDQVRSSNETITLEAVRRAIGQAPDELLFALLKAVDKQSIVEVAQSLADLRDHGVQAHQIAHQLSQRLRQDIIGDNTPLSAQNTLDLLSSLAQVPAANDPSLALELAIYAVALKNTVDTSIIQPDPNKLDLPKIARSKTELARAKTVLSEGAVPEGTSGEVPEGTSKEEKLFAAEVIRSGDEGVSRKSSTTQIAQLNNPIPPKKSVATTSPTPSITLPAKKQSSKAHGALNIESWNEVLTAIKKKHNTLYGIARMATPTFGSDKLILSFAFPFHQKKLSDPKNRQLLSEIIFQVTGIGTSIECILDTAVEPTAISTALESKLQDTINLKTISNIFGGAEIVE